MSGQNQKSLSISFRIDEGVIGHNRNFIANNIDGELICALNLSNSVSYSFFRTAIAFRYTLLRLKLL